jgi:alpha-ketoglutarate-dependent taurine dioxygenase
MALRIRPLHDTFGAEVIGVDFSRDVDAGTLAEIEAAWYRHSILLFRGVTMTPAQHVAFTRKLGPLHIWPGSGQYQRRRRKARNPKMLARSSRQPAQRNNDYFASHVPHSRTGEYRARAIASPHSRALESSTAKQVRAHDLHTPSSKRLMLNANRTDPS